MKKFVLFFSCLLLVGCHQESNDTKTTTQSSEKYKLLAAVVMYPCRKRIKIIVNGT